MEGSFGQLHDPIRLPVAEGYYPEALDKNNQDSFLVKTEVGGNKNVGYFGVYDGHGSTGDKCSNFVRDKIIGLLKSTVGSTETDSAAFDEAYERAYLMCNQLLHRAPFDDRTSGTTAVWRGSMGER